MTFAWACDRGDTETIAKMIYFDNAARTKIKAFIASLPENERSQWKSIDAMAATQLAFEGMASPYPDADVLDAVVMEQVSADRAIFRLPGTHKDQTMFQKTGDVWQFVITEAKVDALVGLAKQVEAAK